MYVADRVSLAQIATAVEDLGQLAKAHRITPDELPGCGFRVTNSGPKGNLFGTAMINQPRIGIVRLGQVVKGPVFVEKDGRNAIAIGPIISLVVAYDHRIIDGATGNGFIFWGLLDTRTWVVF